MTDFNLATADKHQLKFYAKEMTPMLSLSLSMSEATMRERIQIHCKEHDLDGPKAEVMPGRLKKGGKTAVINIAKSPGPNGSEPVFVGVQGVGYTVPRGIDITVPQSVVVALKNAVQHNVTQDIESGEIHKEEVLSYPFSVVSGGN